MKNIEKTLPLILFMFLNCGWRLEQLINLIGIMFMKFIYMREIATSIFIKNIYGIYNIVLKGKLIKGFFFYLLLLYFLFYDFFTPFFLILSFISLSLINNLISILFKNKSVIFHDSLKTTMKIISLFVSNLKKNKNKNQPKQIEKNLILILKNQI